MVAPGSSLVNDARINADDTGRLVSGTDGFGNTIPADTFVGAVSDTGPVSLGPTPAPPRHPTTTPSRGRALSSCSTTAGSR